LSPRRILFPSKKVAKQYAAKCALDALVEKNLIPASSSSVTFPKTNVAPAPAVTSASSATGAAAPETGPSYASQVPDLCISMGITPPSYVIEPIVELGSIYCGYAQFIGEPRISGKIGEFTNVFGKKNAKEACAKEVVSFLRDLRDQLRAKDQLDREAALESLRRQREENNME
jgi:hypothetical protein